MMVTIRISMQYVVRLDYFDGSIRNCQILLFLPLREMIP